MDDPAKFFFVFFVVAIPRAIAAANIYCRPAKIKKAINA